MYKFIILCLLVSLSVSTIFENHSSKLDDRKRIVGGGLVASTTDIPYQAAIQVYYNDKLYGFCGGSLITSKFVLTAAHCLYYSSKVLVGLGVHSMCKFKNSRYVMTSKKFVCHQSYTNDSIDSFDIGLIELPKLVKLDPLTHTINLPKKANAHKSYVGYKAIATGWGRDENFKKSNTLKYLNTVIVKPTDCMFNITGSNVICAFGENSGVICNGDSGGPLVIRDSDNTLTQIGIVSFGQLNCERSIPGVYTRVTKYMDWIEQHSNYKFA